MALRGEYDNELCPIARSLEVFGERWTLLIIRDAFYGVVRFTDFRAHLEIPSAVLIERLRLLVAHEIMTTSVGASGRSEYALTRKGELLWPVVWSIMNWGNEHTWRRSCVARSCIMGAAVSSRRWGTADGVARFLNHAISRYIRGARGHGTPIGTIGLADC